MIVAVFLALILAISAAPQGPSKIATVQLVEAQRLSVARYDFCICQFGPLALIVGGWQAGGASPAIDLFDATSESYIGSSPSLTIPRQQAACVADPLTNKCWIIGGESEKVEIIVLNPTTKTWTIDNTFQDYPILDVVGVACGVVDSVVFCVGGEEETVFPDFSLRPFTYYTDLNTNQWVSGPDVPSGGIYFPATLTDHTTKTIYFCSPPESTNNTGTIFYDRCYILVNPTPGSITWTVESGFQNREGGSFLEVLTLPQHIPAPPHKLLVQYAGIDPVNHMGFSGLDQWYGTTHFNLLNATTGYPTDIATPAAYASAQIGTLAIFVGGSSLSTSEALSVIVVADFYAGVGSAVKMSYHQLALARSGAGVSAYGNKVYVHGGEYESTGLLRDQLEIITIGCSGSSAKGIDLWDDTLGGCEILCHAGYYGPTCAPCNCGGSPCYSGKEGNGSCICAGRYGAGCAGQCNCNEANNGGVCNDGVTGDGTCTCKPGFYGPNCTGNAGDKVVCIVGKGAVDTRVLTPINPGVCMCLLPYGGSNCSANCSCGVNGICNHTGGNCICNSGLFSDATGPDNSDGAKYCNAPCNCSGHGNCDSALGQCVCAPNFYGPKCDFVCDCNATTTCDDGQAGTGACLLIGEVDMSNALSIQISVVLLFVLSVVLVF